MALGGTTFAAGVVLIIAGLCGLIVGPVVYMASRTRPADERHWAVVDATNEAGLAVRVYEITTTTSGPAIGARNAKKGHIKAAKEVWRCEYPKPGLSRSPESIAQLAEKCIQGTGLPKGSFGPNGLPIIVRSSADRTVHGMAIGDPDRSIPYLSKASGLNTLKIGEPASRREAKLRTAFTNLALNVKSVKVHERDELASLKWMSLSEKARADDNRLANATTLGLLDLGGADVDIAFPLANDNRSSKLKAPEDRANMMLFAESIPCYGLDSASSQHYTELIRKGLEDSGKVYSENGTLTVEDPCLPDQGQLLFDKEDLLALFHPLRTCLSQDARDTFKKHICPNENANDDCLSSVLLTAPEAITEGQGSTYVNCLSSLQSTIFHKDDLRMRTALEIPDHSQYPFVVTSSSQTFASLFEGYRLVKEQVLDGLGKRFCDLALLAGNKDSTAFPRQECFYYSFARLLVNNLGFSGPDFGALRVLRGGINHSDADVLNETYWAAGGAGQGGLAGGWILVLLVCVLAMAFVLIIAGAALLRVNKKDYYGDRSWDTRPGKDNEKSRGSDNPADGYLHTPTFMPEKRLKAEAVRSPTAGAMNRLTSPAGVFPRSEMSMISPASFRPGNGYERLASAQPSGEQLDASRAPGDIYASPATGRRDARPARTNDAERKRMNPNPLSRSRPSASASFEPLMNPSPDRADAEHNARDNDDDDSEEESFEAVPGPLPPSSVPSGGDVDFPTAADPSNFRRPGSPLGITSRRKGLPIADADVGKASEAAAAAGPEGPAGSDVDDAEGRVTPFVVTRIGSTATPSRESNPGAKKRGESVASSAKKKPGEQMGPKNSRAPFRSRHQPFQGPAAAGAPQSRKSTPDETDHHQEELNNTGSFSPKPDLDDGATTSPISGGGIRKSGVSVAREFDPTTSGSSPTKILTDASPYPDSAAVSEVPENQQEREPDLQD